MTDITPIIVGIFALAAIIVSGYAIPYIKAKYSAEDLARMMAYIDIAVQAAEQIFAATPGMGSAKKKYVKDWLELQGITFDSKKVDAMIESAVYRLINQFRNLPKAGEEPTDTGGDTADQ